MDNLIGQTFEQYQISGKIGEDRWGLLFKAYDPKFDRSVALFVLRPQITDQGGMGSYILQMARTLVRWRHAGVARILDFGRADNLIYLVREHLPGDSLRQALDELRAQNKWFPVNEAIQLTWQICKVLEYAHQRSMIHGDLHPGVIYLQEERSQVNAFQAIVANFGLVRPTTPPRASEAVYESPEQSRGEDIDTFTDIFAVGALLHELTTGQPLTVDQPPSPRPGLPDVIHKIIHKATAASRNQRYADIQALLRDLTAAAASPELLNEGLTTALFSGMEIEPLWVSYQRRISESQRLNQSAPQSAAIEPVAPPPAPAKSAPPAPDLSQDKIIVLKPDKSSSSIAMKATGLTIGRGSDNDIVLAQSGTSRHHARIDFDGANYLIQDLNSTNGTFIGENEISPDTPTPWQPGEDVRIGDFWLRLERAAQEQVTTAMPADQAHTRPQPSIAAPPPPPAASLPPQPAATRQAQGGVRPIQPVVRADGSVVDEAQILFSASKTIGVYTDTPTPTLTPGNPTSIIVVLVNRGAQPDILRITPIGIPPNWLASRSLSFNVPGGGQTEVQITFQPPRNSDSRAGRQTTILRVASQTTPAQTVDLRLSATVASFSQFSSELTPQNVRSGSLARVVVHNQGNMAETYSLTLDDKTQELEFDPPQAKITIPPGQSAAIEFRASSPPRTIGPEISYAFGAVVNSQSGQYQTHSGQVSSRGIIPPAGLVLIPILCLLLLCLLILGIRSMTAPQREARQTQDTYETAIAGIAQGTFQAQTATARVLQNANQATLQAATSTAGWSTADYDNDGLNNLQEAQYFTKNDAADTDNDGLKDGEEVLKWKTNPLLQDSDTDGLNDNIEVSKGFDPSKKDTDGDGMNDAVDPDPLHGPTATSTFISSITPTLTRTPTTTSTQQPPTADLFVTVNNGVPTTVPGTNVAYTILVTNRGPSAITDIQVIDAFPNIITNVTWVCSATAGSACQAPNGAGNINTKVNLAVNGTATFIAGGTVNPNATGLLINTANVNAPLGIIEPNTADNLSIDTDGLTPKVAFSLSITDNRTTVSPGEATSYSIVAVNNGPSAVTGVHITDIFPDALTNITWNCTTTAGSSCQQGGPQTGNVDASVTMMPGGVVTITANGVIKLTAAGTVSNSVSLASPIDPAANNKTATDTTAITTLTDLFITAAAPFTATTNTPITYTIGITNSGPAAATNVVLTTIMPVGVTFVGSIPGTPNCNAAATLITCNLGNLPVNSSFSVTIVLITPGAPGTITAQFQVLLTEPDPTPVNNQKTVDIIVQ